ncbi:hypothetical protein PHLCEN_2v3232 [Hermanssonia centrifuga]|uniref:Uncharacterized protein n=1 Tax=Hermanssonia centrifuga TaxID=98765 RepID=A0A2R6QXK5_9APHY|nr:hypothetical protein PHLCEN_2v3232 [Hermanssonia centrifuga]
MLGHFFFVALPVPNRKSSIEPVLEAVSRHFTYPYFPEITAPPSPRDEVVRCSTEHDRTSPVHGRASGQHLFAREGTV